MKGSIDYHKKGIEVWTIISAAAIDELKPEFVAVVHV